MGAGRQQRMAAMKVISEHVRSLELTMSNTNIACNVGAQIDPKDIDYLETQRGGYSAENGDRTYGVFNVVPAL
jgi:hypothetical protein